MAKMSSLSFSTPGGRLSLHLTCDIKTKYKMNLVKLLSRAPCIHHQFHQRFLSSGVNVFNSKVKRIQRDIALSDPDSHIYDYLKEEIAFRVSDRIFDIKRLILD